MHISFIITAIMIRLIITVLLIGFPIHAFAGFFEPKVLSPSSNVHVDVVNHVAGALDNHSQGFHHSWRDYLLLIISLLFVSVCICGCLYAAYRRLLLNILRRAQTSPVLTVNDLSHPTTRPFMIT